MSTCRAAAAACRPPEIDKLPDGGYRATVGTLFEHQEICRTRDLEALLRHAHAMQSCRSFDDVVRAIRAHLTSAGWFMQNGTVPNCIENAPSCPHTWARPRS
jgi:hypothetical protein